MSKESETPKDQPSVKLRKFYNTKQIADKLRQMKLQRDQARLMKTQQEEKETNMNSFAALAKLSDKLDSAGLTREADLVDLVVKAGVTEDLDKGFFGQVEDDVVKPSGTAEVIPFKAFDDAFDKREQPQYYWRIAFAPDKSKLTPEQVAMEGKRVSKDFLDAIEAKGVAITAIPVDQKARA